MFPVVPLGISVAVAGLDGFVASIDAKNYAAAPAPSSGPKPVNQPLLQRKTLWVQGGAVLAGLVGEFAGWDPNYTEPLMFTGAALFAREMAFQIAQGSQPVASQIPSQGYRAYVPAAPAIAGPAPASFNGRPSQQLPSASGYLREQLPSPLG